MCTLCRLLFLPESHVERGTQTFSSVKDNQGYEGVCKIGSPALLAYARPLSNDGSINSLNSCHYAHTSIFRKLHSLLCLQTVGVRCTSTYGSPELMTIPRTAIKTAPRMMRLRIRATCSFTGKEP